MVLQVGGVGGRAGAGACLLVCAQPTPPNSAKLGLSARFAAQRVLLGHCIPPPPHPTHPSDF